MGSAAGLATRRDMGAGLIAPRPGPATAGASLRGPLGLAWGAVAAAFLLMLAGAVLRLQQWVLDLSPFTHLPHLPGSPVSATPLVALSLVAVVLTGAGLVAFHRRDVPGG